MREISSLDIGIAAFVALVGSLSLGTAVQIWNAIRTKGGNLFVAAICWSLAAFGLWSGCIALDVAYLYYTHAAVLVVARDLANIDRLILAIPQCIIILWVIPQAGKK